MLHTRHLTQRVSHLITLTLFVTLLSVAIIPAGDVASAPLAIHSPLLGSADNFAVLAETLISSAANTSVITGDVGLDAGTGAAIGVQCAELVGSSTIYDNDGAYTGAGGGSTLCRITDDPLVSQAKVDLGTAYDELIATDNATCDTDFGVGPYDLEGDNLGPGIYCVGAGGFLLSTGTTGTLTLTGSGIWIFRSETTIDTDPGAIVSGGDPCNVWWRAETSATIGTDTTFVGSILALDSISDDGGSTINGRLLARNGAVTLANTTINRPLCSATSITTALSASSVTAGNSVFDSATLSGVTGNAGGSVTYTVYTDNACTLNAQTAGTFPVTDGVVPNSNSIQFNSAGTFFWQAVYSGDSNNLGATSVCTSEQLTVNAVVPATSAPGPAATSAPTQAPTNTPVPTATTVVATAPAVVGLPAAGGTPARRVDIPLTALLAASVAGAIALGLSVRARRRARQ